MKRVLSLIGIMALFAALAVVYSNGTVIACGMDSSKSLTKAGYGYSQEQTAEKLENVHMKVDGMTCGMCVGKIKSELAKLPEVRGSEINWEKGIADVQVTMGSNHKALGEAIKKAGFKASSIECECKS